MTPGQAARCRAALARDVVLVTGPPRSGTTVVGSQLGLVEGACALYEPMNGDSGDRSITRYFERPGYGSFSEAQFEDLVRRIAALDLRLKPGVFRHERGMRRLAKLLIGGQSRRSLRRARLTSGLKTVIWKDPLAALAARAAIERFDLPVVVTYRPPEAVVASYKRLNWYFDVHRIHAALGAPCLPGGALQARERRDLVDAAAVLWTMIYSELAALARARPDRVSILRMDDVIDDPRRIYTELYARLGLTAGAAAEAGTLRAEAARDATGKADLPSGHPHATNRNLRAANAYWRKVLTPQETLRVAERTADLRAEVEALPAIGAFAAA